MAELADAADSKSADRKVVGVRPPLPAPRFQSLQNPFGDPSCYRVRLLMCPESKYSPARSSKQVRRVQIAGFVALYLCCPIARVRRSWYVVCRTSMPETAVHKDRDWCATEDEI